MLDTQDLGHGITCIDTGYTRPGMTACYLMEQDGEAAFIETGVNRNVPGLLQLLDQRGIHREEVSYVIPTHVHLDHAGGAGQLMQALPKAQLVIHPRGTRHMVNPAALIKGASAVYGGKKFLQMYGEILSIDTERVVEAPDNFYLRLGGRGLVFLDTPGHARHHFCIYDEQSQGVFSGDTFGLSYREFDTADKEFCFPTTTPVQFDPEALHQSIDRILSLRPRQVYLTHFGGIQHVQEAADQLHHDIDQFVKLTRRLSRGDNEEEQLTEILDKYLSRRASDFNSSLSSEEVHSLIHHDAKLNAQGLLLWVNQ